MQDGRLRIGTRGSPLALIQAALIRVRIAGLLRCAEECIEILPISTQGDRERSRPMRALGGHGIFCREIEAALLAGTVDIGVHSMKDMPVRQPEGLAVDCVPEREDARDALLSKGQARIADLPPGSVVGTSSIRRQAQLRRCNPRLRIVEFRGNLDTRIGKLEAGGVDAAILAMAGLKRLGARWDGIFPIPESELLPAPAQGAICLERRVGDGRVAELCGELNDVGAWRETLAERSFLAELGGNCQTPAGARARIEGEMLTLRGEFLHPGDASESASGEISGDCDDAANLGRNLAVRLREELRSGREGGMSGGGG